RAAGGRRKRPAPRRRAASAARCDRDGRERGAPAAERERHPRILTFPPPERYRAAGRTARQPAAAAALMTGTPAMGRPRRGEGRLGRRCRVLPCDDVQAMHDRAPAAARRASGRAGPMSELLYLEDLAVGQRYTTGTATMTADDIKAFATQFDPQPFHLDEAAAHASPFGGLI